MADIFLSYASRDVGRIERLVEILEQQGWSVWWDLKIRIGKSFDQVIEEEITKAKCIVVLWSAESVKSDWVRGEADEGRRRRVLAPVLLDNVVIPLAFRHLEAARLYDWKGQIEHPELQLLLHAIGDIIGQAPKPPEPVESERPGAKSKGFSFDLLSRRARLAILSGILLVSLGAWFLARYFIFPRESTPQTVANYNDSPANANGKETPPLTLSANHNDSAASAQTKEAPSRPPIAEGQVAGIDVSKFSEVDWTKVNKNSVSFIVIRATESTANKDDEFDRNWEGAKRAGIIRGAYHVFHPEQDAAAQANFFLTTVSFERGDLPPVLAVERGGKERGVDGATFASRVRTWLTLVQKATGRKPIIYTSASFWNDNMTDDFGDYPLWIASYGGPAPRALPKGWKTWTFWQYTDHAGVEGAGGAVDANYFNGSYQDLQNFIAAR